MLHQPSRIEHTAIRRRSANPIGGDTAVSCMNGSLFFGLQVLLPDAISLPHGEIDLKGRLKFSEKQAIAHLRHRFFPRELLPAFVHIFTRRGTINYLLVHLPWPFMMCFKMVATYLRNEIIVSLYLVNLKESV